MGEFVLVLLALSLGWVCGYMMGWVRGGGRVK
jgi:hypothetical protein